MLRVAKSLWPLHETRPLAPNLLTLVCLCGWFPVLRRNDGQTYLTLLVYVRVIDFCLKRDLGRFEGVLSWVVYMNPERTFIERWVTLETGKVKRWMCEQVQYFVSWEPEGRYQYSKMFCLEPEGRYRCTKSMAIAPFWFSSGISLKSDSALLALSWWFIWTPVFYYRYVLF